MRSYDNLINSSFMKFNSGEKLIIFLLLGEERWRKFPGWGRRGKSVSWQDIIHSSLWRWMKVVFFSEPRAESLRRRFYTEVFSKKWSRTKTCTYPEGPGSRAGNWDRAALTGATRETDYTPDWLTGCRCEEREGKGTVGEGEQGPESRLSVKRRNIKSEGS